MYPFCPARSASSRQRHGPAREPEARFGSQNGEKGGGGGVLVVGHPPVTSPSEPQKPHLPHPPPPLKKESKKKSKDNNKHTTRFEHMPRLVHKRFLTHTHIEMAPGALEKGCSSSCDVSHGPVRWGETMPGSLVARCFRLPHGFGSHVLLPRDLPRMPCLPSGLPSFSPVLLFLPSIVPFSLPPRVVPLAPRTRDSKLHVSVDAVVTVLRHHNYPRCDCKVNRQAFPRFVALRVQHDTTAQKSLCVSSNQLALFLSGAPVVTWMPAPEI